MTAHEIGWITRWRRTGWRLRREHRVYCNSCGAASGPWRRTQREVMRDVRDHAFDVGARP